MKVALIGRNSLHSVTGGDTIQMVRTASALRHLGVEVDIFLSSERIDYDAYDLLHFFNLLRPADHLGHIRRSRKPYVVSTIYLEYADFDRHGRGKAYGLLFGSMGKHRAEYVKNLYRFVRGQDRMASPEYLLGHRRAMLRILASAALILPNSMSEYRRVVADTGYDGRFAIIPNGIDPAIFGTIPGDVLRQDKVLCVAQVYGMKNQLTLIEACRSLKVPLEIIGKAPPNHRKYYDLCRHAGNGFTTFVDFLPQPELVRHYAAARVHALPSWFETTGLTSLEAGAMGCRLVVGTGGDTREYFRDMACYCDAQDPQSIAGAVEQALNLEPGPALRDLILSEYTWEKAAEKTREAYNNVLNG